MISAARLESLRNGQAAPPHRMKPAESLSIQVSGQLAVSALLQSPNEPRALYVLAHGAGAGMAHPFLAAVADGLAERAIATLRFNFPSMERGSRRPDTPAVAHQAVRAAVALGHAVLPEVPLFAGGRSFGGRMTSQAQALEALPGVRGLVFLGFPLHPAGKPSTDRAKHLAEVRIPLLFLQGTRDELAQVDLLEAVCRELGAGAALRLFPHADHSFHVPARSGLRDADVRDALLGTMAAWVRTLVDR